MRDSRSLRILLLPSLAAVLLGTTALAGSAATAPQGAALPRSVLVGFRPNVSLAGQADALADAGVERVRRYPQIRSALVSVGAQSTAGAIRDLDSDPRVAFAEPNFTVRANDVTPNDPFLPQLWGLHNTGQTVNWRRAPPTPTSTPRKHGRSRTGSPDVVVAVIDTGSTLTPDLAGNIWVNPGEDCAGLPTNGIDDDGNGYVDDWRGWDFVNGDNNPTDDNGHGTHVAGTIGAAGNNGTRRDRRHLERRRSCRSSSSAADGTGTAADAISADPLRPARRASPVLQQLMGRRRVLAGHARRDPRRTRAASCSLPQRATTSRTPTRRPTTRPATTSPTSSRSVRPTSSTARPGSRTTARGASTSAHPERTSTRPGAAARTASRTARRWRRLTWPGQPRWRRPCSRTQPAWG